VPVFGVAKTVADLFRYRRTVGDALAIEGLRQALRQSRATPAEIAREAEVAGVWATMEPYVMALTSDALSPAKHLRISAPTSGEHARRARAEHHRAVASAAPEIPSSAHATELLHRAGAAADGG